MKFSPEEVANLKQTIEDLENATILLSNAESDLHQYGLKNNDPDHLLAKCRKARINTRDISHILKAVLVLERFVP